MGRKNSPSAKKELVTLITNYEEAKAENRQLYLDADQLASSRELITSLNLPFLSLFIYLNTIIFDYTHYY